MTILNLETKVSTQCRFCGGKVFADATDCKHCGKVLKKKANPEPEERGGLTNLNSWDKSIPSWVMYLVCGFFLFCLILLFVKGCQGTKPAPDPDQPASAKASHQRPNELAAMKIPFSLREFNNISLKAVFNEENSLNLWLAANHARDDA